MTDFDDNFLINTQLEELTMEPWYKNPLKLVFHDINGTVLYIGDGCPIMIYISKGKIVGDFDKYYLTI